jgi:hypothetical protein
MKPAMLMLSIAVSIFVMGCGSSRQSVGTRTATENYTATGFGESVDPLMASDNAEANVDARIKAQIEFDFKYLIKHFMQEIGVCRDIRYPSVPLIHYMPTRKRFRKMKNGFHVEVVAVCPKNNARKFLLQEIKSDPDLYKCLLASKAFQDFEKETTKH